MTALHSASGAHAVEEISDSMTKLLAEEKAAAERIERAGFKAQQLLAEARGKAQEVIAQAHEMAAEEKLAIVKEAEEKMLAEAKRVVSQAEKQAAELRAQSFHRVGAASEKMLYKLLHDY